MDARHRARPLVEIVKYRFFFLTTRADKNTRLLMYSIYPRIRRSTKRTSNVIFLSLVPVKKRSIEFSTSKKTTIKHWLGSNYAAISSSSFLKSFELPPRRWIFRERGRYRDHDDGGRRNMFVWLRFRSVLHRVGNFDKVIDVFACLDEIRQV